MSEYELTIEEIAKYENTPNAHFGGDDSYWDIKSILKAQVAKLQSYYASLAPEKLVEEVEQCIERTRWLNDKHFCPHEATKIILSLVMAYYLEKIEGIENRYKPHPGGLIMEVYDLAIQAVLKVIKEVE